MENATTTRIADKTFTEHFVANRHFVNGKRVSREAFSAAWRDAKVQERMRASTAEAEEFLASIPGWRK